MMRRLVDMIVGGRVVWTVVVRGCSPAVTGVYSVLSVRVEVSRLQSCSDPVLGIVCSVFSSRGNRENAELLV